MNTFLLITLLLILAFEIIQIAYSKRIVEIKNNWNWGYTIHLIKNGCSHIEIEFKNDTTWGYLSGLMVEPRRMKQGIATKLMQKAEEIIKREGLDLAVLSVDKDREWVKDWYERMGYEVYDEDDLYWDMRKSLNN